MAGNALALALQREFQRSGFIDINANLPAFVPRIKGGKIIYIDGESGNDGRDGSTPALAKASIASAMAAATAGSMLCAFPGSYEENVVFTKDYISLVGAMINGYGKPDIVPDSGIAVSTGSFQGITLGHLRCVSADGDAVKIIGNGFVLSDIWCEAASDGILLSPNEDDDHYTASEGRIVGCVIRSCAQGIRFFNPGPGDEGGVGPTDNLISDCLFYGITNQDLIDEHTAGGNNVCFGNTIVRDCIHADRNKAVYITLTNGSGNTGVILRPAFAVDSAALDNVMVALATGITCVGPMSSDGIVDASGF